MAHLKMNAICVRSCTKFGLFKAKFRGLKTCLILG